MLADFTDGKPCLTSQGESVATLGPEPVSPSLSARAPSRAHGLGWGRGGQAHLPAQFVWGLSPPHKNISTDRVCFAHCWISSA